jgi:hypothetical protein
MRAGRQLLVGNVAKQLGATASRPAPRRSKWKPTTNQLAKKFANR